MKANKQCCNGSRVPRAKQDYYNTLEIAIKETPEQLADLECVQVMFESKTSSVQIVNNTANSTVYTVQRRLLSFLCNKR